METARVLSLGAGVQSSALLLMADRGLVTRPDFAVFADTGAEPKSVYVWLEGLKSHVSIPIYKTMYRNLYEDTMVKWRNFHSIPAYIHNPNGSVGMGRRQCTYRYKIDPIYTEIRKRLGYQPRKHVKHRVFVQMGISTDEIQRMKESRLKWVTNEFPLIFERRSTRKDCVEYVQQLLGVTPPRSACTFCPYRSNEEWRHLRDTEPEGWAQAMEVDQAIRSTKAYRGTLFLHADCKPLAEVDLDGDNNQYSFDDECDGMCGV